jgi:hypothetical protein
LNGRLRREFLNLKARDGLFCFGGVGVKSGYYVRLLYSPWWFEKVIYLEGRVIDVTVDGFLLDMGDDVEFIEWRGLVAYRLGKYG